MVDEAGWATLVDGCGLDRREATWIAEEAAGSPWSTIASSGRASALSHRRFTSMVERRAAGEPLQYVLGHWSFRRLDLLVDRRVLIPRPETEWVVEAALGLVPSTGELTVVDLGTGSGAIALSLADELWPRATVHATDASAAALDVARANLAGLGRRGATVRLHEGSWFDALPPALAGTVDLLVSNPPYVAPTDPLPPEVADWEPASALVPAGAEHGREDVETILAGAPSWLRPGGAVVVEIGETQGDAVAAAAAAAGLVDVEVRPDPAGRDRILLARRRRTGVR